METTRKYTNLAPVCEETITHDMELITKAAEKNIGAELPEDFGVILDDCTFGSEHYMAVASFVSALFRFLLPYEDDLDQVQLLMKHLRTIKQAAKLRLKTPLKPKLRQVTRWWSTYSMSARYFELPVIFQLPGTKR
ncbi:hypothetical protein PC123_g5630 [Phytophthora cactorum]|nr:hypothetical protein PC123_g5630 [Phytophthora cactorum]